MITAKDLLALSWLPPQVRAFLNLIPELDEDGCRAAMREAMRTNLWLLMVIGLQRQDLIHPWLLARSEEVQAAPDGYLDLWARAHYKSTIITFAKTIQDVLASHGEDPLPSWQGQEATFGIFSHTRPIAKAFLRQIKLEFERNEFLQELFPDILYARPQRDSPRWSEDSGLIVRRQSNPKESTIEAWGLVDGQPTSKHFGILIWDDAVVVGSVSTPEMIEKTTQAWELSLNLGTEKPRLRMIGTRYHFGDTYRAVLERGSMKARLHPATIDGTLTGAPVLLSPEALKKKMRDMGPYTACFVCNTPILMGDFTQKNIVDIRAGDTVIGFTVGTGKGNKGRIVQAKVLGGASRPREVVRIAFASGRVIECTPDHKFFTGRSGKDAHKVYSALGLGYHDLKGAIAVYDPGAIKWADPERAAYLCGLFDGEGSALGGCLAIAQSHEHNPEVAARIEQVLNDLGFKYSKYIRAASKVGGRNAKAGTQYALRGGRAETIRFLNVVQPAKAYQVVEMLLKQSSRRQCSRGTSKYSAGRDRVVSITPIGKREVFNIETETGNYIAGGYMVKNSSQLLLNPLADSAYRFERKWLDHRFDRNTVGWKPMQRALICDPSSGKKGSDFTAMGVIGKGPDRNVYLLDFLRDRLSLKERAEEYIKMHKRWSPQHCGYEEYGMQADIEYIKSLQNDQTYRFDITPLAGKLSKFDRVNRLVPVASDGHLWLPEDIHRTNHEGQLQELIGILVEQEFLAWPVPAHDDGVDMISRYFDLEFFNFPVADTEQPREDRYGRVRYRGSIMSA